MQPFQVQNEDDQLLMRLKDRPIFPVFIMGLHRSGTTFLYASLAQAYSLVPLTIHDIVFYPRLLNRHHTDHSQDDRNRLEAYFSKYGLSNRVIDDVALTPNTVEEYGWLLLRYGRSPRLKKSTAALFIEFCRKLHYLHPNSEMALFKNPADTPYAAHILKLLPQARFIFIRRNPIKILNSQLKSAIVLASSLSRYQNLLLTGSPIAKHFYALYRLMYRSIGPVRFERLLMWLLTHTIPREIRRYHESFRQLPKESRIEVTYEQLIEQPEVELKRVGKFLGLAPGVNLSSVNPHPRQSELHPAVRQAKDAFLERLECSGIFNDER